MNYILYIDDDADDHFFFTQALSELDPTILCICQDSGEKALEMLASANSLPDLIFLDMNMPRMNGIEFLKALPDLRLKDRLRIVVYSTSDMAFTTQEALQLGASAYLTKGNSIEEIKDKLSMFVPQTRPGTQGHLRMTG